MDLVQKFGWGVLAFKLPIMGMKWQVEILISLELLLPYCPRNLPKPVAAAAPPLKHFLLFLSSGFSFCALLASPYRRLSIVHH
jgi:hypothetical protein